MKLKQQYHILSLIGTFFLSLSAHNVLNTPFSFGNQPPDYRYHRQQLRNSSQFHAIWAQTQTSQSYTSSLHMPTEQEKQDAQRAQREKKYREAMQKREKRKRFWYKCAILWKKTCNIFTFHSTNCGIQSITEQYYGTSDTTQQQLPAHEPAPALQKNNTQASQAIIAQTIKEHMPAIKQTFDRFQSTLTQQPDLATVDRYLNRLQALQEAGGDPHKAIACEYTVNQQAQGLLAKQGVDLDDVTQFYGTPLQQVIHGEYVDWLNAVADEQVPPECAELMEGLHDIHQGGMELNKQGLVAPAMTVSDFLWESLGVLRGAAYGAGDSIAGLTHMVAHPIQTTKDLTYTCFMAGYLYGTFLRECLTVLVMSFDDPDEAIAYRDEHVKVLWDAAKQGLNTIKDLSQEEKARHASRVAADIFVAPKIAKGCTKLAGLAAGTCGSALSELSDLANFMDLVPGAAMLQDAQTAKKAQEALVVVTEFEESFDMPNRFNALANAHKHGGKIAKGLEEMTPEIRQYLKKIYQSEELKRLAHFYTKEALIEALQCYEVDVMANDLILPKEFERTTRDIFRLNSDLNYIQLKYNSAGKVTLKSVEKAARNIGKYEAIKAKKVLEFVEKRSKKDIFKYITPSKALYPQSLIPEAFVLEASGVKVWLNETGTKHLHELTSSPVRLEDFSGSLSSLGEQTLIGHEEILKSLQKAVAGIDWNTIVYDKKFTSNDWEIAVLEAKEVGQFPIIRHLRKLHRF